MIDSNATINVIEVKKSIGFGKSIAISFFEHYWIAYYLYGKVARKAII